MTCIDKVLVESKFIEDAQTTQYVATNVTALIDKCTITNISAGTVEVNVHLVSNGGVADSSNLFMDSVVILPGKSYPCPEITGHLLGEGDFISTFTVLADTLAFRVSGRESPLS